MLFFFEIIQACSRETSFMTKKSCIYCIPIENRRNVTLTCMCVAGSLFFLTAYEDQGRMISLVRPVLFTCFISTEKV